MSLLGKLGLELGRAAGQVVETFEGMEAGLLGVLAARALLEDWVLHLKTKMMHEKHQYHINMYMQSRHHIKPFTFFDQLHVV